MKKALILLLTVSTLLSLVVVALLSSCPCKKKEKANSHLAKVTEEKPFVIIIPSYNNSTYCEKNLHSVLEQKYNNYRVIYIDDCSKDDTYEKVKNYLAHAKEGHRVTLIRNSQNKGALANLYHAIHSCKDNEIVVTVDGDDFLAHPDVLSKLNRVYTKNDVWMTYGNYLDYPAYNQNPVICKEIPKRVIANSSYRTHAWVSSHLRTFYATLFKKIKLQDMLYNGTFLPMGWDLAFMLPMLEMAGPHMQFIKETLYLYNRTNPLNDHKVNISLQHECEVTVRNLPKYPLLNSLNDSPQESAFSADLVVFSFDRPMQLYALLESIQRYVKNTNVISVIYRASNEAFLEGYNAVQKKFASVHFLKQSDQPALDFRPLLLKSAFERSSSPYILFAVDDIIVKDHIDLKECIEAIEKTGAYGFYLGYGQHIDYCYMQNCSQAIPLHITLDNHTFAWQFKQGFADWKYPNSVDMVLYRKADIEQDLNKIAFTNPNTMEQEWAKRAKNQRVGLFFETSKIVNIPLNIVNVSTNRNMNVHSAQQLLELFEQGLKIDISPLFRIDNHSRHIEYEPRFIAQDL